MWDAGIAGSGLTWYPITLGYHLIPSLKDHANPPSAYSLIHSFVQKVYEQYACLWVKWISRLWGCVWSLFGRGKDRSVLVCLLCKSLGTPGLCWPLLWVPALLILLGMCTHGLWRLAWSCRCVVNSRMRNGICRFYEEMFFLSFFFTLTAFEKLEQCSVLCK